MRRRGGAVRSAELTLPGFVHDPGSAIYPMGAGSPFFRSLELERYGLEWVKPEVAVAHPLEGGVAAALTGTVDETARGLGGDEGAYRRLMRPLVERWAEIADEILQPLPHVPRRPVALGEFGARALWPAEWVMGRWFKEERARALFAGLAGHSFLPFGAMGSSAVAVALGMMGHAVGWPFPRWGAQALTNALVGCLEAAGGRVECGRAVESLAELPEARAVLLDVPPGQFRRLAGGRLPRRYGWALGRYRMGPGVFKIDYALDGPVPWRDEVCGRAGTVHVGGSAGEIAAGEETVARGGIPDRPFVLGAQHTVFDASRAPAGKHTFWAYCHVPNGSIFDMTSRIEGQIERFAPGFRERVLARHVMGPAALEGWNRNLTGGDISGGATSLWQMVARPVATATPYRTPLPGVYLCSSSTPPGGGVHGMCGYHAARAALADVFA